MAILLGVLIIVMKIKVLLFLTNWKSLLVSTNREENLNNNSSTINYVEFSLKFALLLSYVLFEKSGTELGNDSNHFPVSVQN